MNGVTALRAAVKPEVKVSVKIDKAKHAFRLKQPSYEDVLDWGDKSAELDRLMEEKKLNNATGYLRQAVLVLKKTLVVDDDQPEMTDAEVAELVQYAGGLVRNDAELVLKARDLMWDAAGFNGALDAEAVDKEAAKKELPFESPGGTG